MQVCKKKKKKGTSDVKRLQGVIVERVIPYLHPQALGPLCLTVIPSL